MAKPPMWSWREPREGFRQAWVRQIGAGVIAVTIAMLCFGVMNQLGSGNMPDYGPFFTPRFGSDMAGSVLAGFQEELLFSVSLPVLVLATCRDEGIQRRWLWYGVGLSAILRMLFHLYYGWPAPVLLVWATLTPLIVLTTRSLWGVMLVHSLYDVSVEMTSLSKCAPGGGHCTGHPWLAALVPMVFAVSWLIMLIWTVLKLFTLVKPARVRSSTDN